MRAPSLFNRVVAMGVAVVAVLVVAMDVLLYLSLKFSLRHEVESVLSNQATLVAAEAAHVDATELPFRLAEFDVAVSVIDPSGTIVRSPLLETTLGRERLATQEVDLGAGVRAEVAASLSDSDETLRRVLRLEMVASPLVVALAFLLLRLIAEFALRPLDQIANAARRTTGGVRGERLRPDRTDTHLGQMAEAYDNMVDALEEAVAEARAAQALSVSLQERDREILETAQEAFVAMDESGLITDWNVEAERTFGWTREEAIGRPVADTIVPQHLREAHWAGLEHFNRTGGGLILGRQVELTALRRSGEVFPVEMTVWATRHDGTTSFNAFIRDITERTSAQQAMAQLAAIVEWTDAAMLSTDLEGNILSWNRGAERIYGYSPDEAVGQHLSLIVPDQCRSHVAMAMAMIREGKAVQGAEAVRRRKDGTLIDVSLTISPVRNAEGKIHGASSIARDITEERRIRAQLDATLLALEGAVEEARSSEAATRHFLDDAAHQLRTPITSIRVSAELLLRGASPEERDRLLAAVVRESTKAGRLMSGLLQMARLNQGQKLSPEPCDLLELCNEEAERTRSIAPQLDLVVADSSTGPLGHPELDPHAVGEILANLLDNARRHASSRIDVVLGRDNGVVEVRVADDGAGVPDDMEDAVFERFVSLDTLGGSGLGLPIARELARAHGGDLWYQEKAFVLRLPAER